MFLLRPSRRANQIFRFCLAVAANRTGVLVHAYCAMSNHYHLVVTDRHGCLPEFMHWFNEFLAKCLNAELGRWESFWAPGSYSAVELVGRETLIERLVYVFANPVKAGLVSSHRDWPGARSLPEHVSGWTEVVKRPTGFFRDEGPVPKEATLTLTPHELLGDSGDDWRRELIERVTTREDEIRDRVARDGARFLGRARVLKQSPFGVPASIAHRRGLSPRLAATDKWKRVESLTRLRSFLQAYREALQRYLGGDRLAVFPAGTYLMRERFGVLCHSP